MRVKAKGQPKETATPIEYVDRRGDRRIGFLVEVPFYGYEGEASRTGDEDIDRVTPHTALMKAVRLGFGYETSIELVYDTPGGVLNVMKARMKAFNRMAKDLKAIIAKEGD